MRECVCERELEKDETEPEDWKKEREKMAKETGIKRIIECSISNFSCHRVRPAVAWSCLEKLKNC